jgi:membrane associated rhomboid family serine protease
MIPLKDDVPSRTVPIVTVLLVAANVAAFMYQVSLEVGDHALVQRGGASSAGAFVHEFGVVPCRLTGACEWDFPSPVVTIFTSMFLHGGLLHIAGNMLYLWIFGDNVEDSLGHGRFLLFYALCGVAAAASQTVAAPTSPVPMIGASGAVSGVLGAYLLLFPYARIRTLIVFGFFIRVVRVPAMIVLGFWIVMQVGNAFLSATLGAPEGGGIAWFAHIGGFAAGVAFLFVMRPRRKRRL